jgi:hypothetical protein
MPVSQHPDLAEQQPGVQTRSTAHPAAPQQSPDFAPQKISARPASALLKKRRQNKTVHWDHSVIDNEKKIKVPSARPLTPPITKKSKSSAALPQSSIYLNPSQKSLTAMPAPVANTSGRMDSPFVRPLAHSIIPSGQSTFTGQDPRYPIQYPDQYMVTAASKPPTHIPSTQRSDQAPAANSSSKRNPDPRTHHHTHPAGASSPGNAPKMKTQRPEATRIPPRVPDPPQLKKQGPPPTPRITRLPTPDLPDISGRKFCVCSDCKRLADSKGKPIHVKMNAQSKKPCGPSRDEHC